MKQVYLYLDIDGVLNDFYKVHDEKEKESYRQSVKSKPRSTDKEFVINELMANHVANIDFTKLFALSILLKIYHITDIIICSTWRYIYSPEEMKTIFFMKGFPDIAMKITGETKFGKNDSIESMENETGFSNGKDNEILSHIKENNVKEFYILDDDIFNLDIWKEETLLLPILNYIENNVVIRETLNRMMKLGDDLYYLNRENNTVPSKSGYDIIHNFKHANGKTYEEATKEFKSGKGRE